MRSFLPFSKCQIFSSCKILSLAALTGFVALGSSSAFASTIHVGDPVGWTRDDADTAFVTFDVFTGSGEGPVGSTSDSYQSNGLSDAALSIVGADTASFGPLLLGGPAPADNRIYTADEPMTFSLSASVPFQTNFAYVQIVEAGAPNGFDTVTLGGAAPTSVSSAFYDSDGQTVWTYQWDQAALSGGIAAGSLELTMQENAIGHLSFDAVTADFSSNFTPVPEPGTAGLIGLAACGWILGRRNRRRN